MAVQHMIKILLGIFVHAGGAGYHGVAVLLAFFAYGAENAVIERIGNGRKQNEQLA